MPHVHTAPIEFHDGERKVQSLLHVPSIDNPTSPGLSPYALHLCNLSSLLALGTIDDEGRPWTTLFGGQPGFVRPLGQSLIGMKTQVDRCYDPVVELLSGQVNKIYDVGQDGKPISALGLHLASRDRVKLAGKVVHCNLENLDSGAEEGGSGVAECQMVFTIQRSLGNCPKYMNKKVIQLSRIHEQEPTLRPELLSTSLPLSAPALKLLAKSDMFFITASNQGSSMSTNHRGGPPGFVRVAQNDETGVTLVYPEFSGNRLYQTLGNLYMNPKAGIIFPDFDTGDVLYATGTTDIIFGKDAAAILPRSNLALRINLDSARFVRRGLPFRGVPGELSPYNPPVRYLAGERNLPDVQIHHTRVVYAKLLARSMLSPSIARFKFSISDPETAGRWQPGQYVALAFEDDLSTGYSHMRADDPRSLNDDFVRSWTVSSPPGRDERHDEFEITVRNVGVVTNFLFRYNIRAGLEVPLKGFGGSFVIEQGPSDIVPFIAGGIGITPLLGQIPGLDLERLRLFWSLNASDIGLAVDTCKHWPGLAPSTHIFLSNCTESNITERRATEALAELGVRITTRRMLASDIKEEQHLSPTWYLCAGTTLREKLLEWLPGKHTKFEDFDF